MITSSHLWIIHSAWEFEHGPSPSLFPCCLSGPGVWGNWASTSRISSSLLSLSQALALTMTSLRFPPGHRGDPASQCGSAMGNPPSGLEQVFVFLWPSVSSSVKWEGRNGHSLKALQSSHVVENPSPYLACPIRGYVIEGGDRGLGVE